MSDSVPAQDAANNLSMTERDKKRSHLLIAGKLVALTFAMFGFGYLMVPLYDIICEVTGLNGKTGRVSIAQASTAPVAEDREVTVEFVANINQSGAWRFEPTIKQMKVIPGKLYHASYRAENLTGQAVVAQATPSVSPFVAAKYFNKTECFCFTRQEFEPHGSRDMPLTFIIDADIPINVDRVTLSYTFFNTPDQNT